MPESWLPSKFEPASRGHPVIPSQPSTASRCEIPAVRPFRMPSPSIQIPLDPVSRAHTGPLQRAITFRRFAPVRSHSQPVSPLSQRRAGEGRVLEPSRRGLRCEPPARGSSRLRRPRRRRPSYSTPLHQVVRIECGRRDLELPFSSPSEF